MRWLKPNFKSIHSFFGHAAPARATPGVRMDDVRHAMLQAIPPSTPDQPNDLLFRRIRHAESIEALWYARSDLMAAIAAARGEAWARSEMRVITELFRGLLPESRNYRRRGGGAR